MPTLTVAEAKHRYLRERTGRREFTEDTRRTVDSILERFIRHVGVKSSGESRAIGAITKGHVRAWWGSLRVSRSTARNQLSTVRTFLRWCVDEGYMRSDPSRTIKPPREPRRVPKTCSPTDTTTLITSLPDRRAVVIVMWMLHLGLRCGEVARIEIGDIDTGAKLLTVRGKGGHERILPIPVEAWVAMLGYLQEHPATSGPLIRRYDDNYRGLSPHYVSDLVRRWMRDAGVKIVARDGMSGHALRRTCASDLLDGGAHIRQVQQVLGHASIATTERYLRRQDAKDLRSIVEGRQYHGDQA